MYKIGGVMTGGRRIFEHRVDRYPWVWNVLWTRREAKQAHGSLEAVEQNYLIVC